MDKGEALVIIDTMPFEESYKKEHIQGAKNFAFVKEAKSGDDWSQIVEGSGTPEQLLALLGDDKTRPVVFYCGFVKCGRSHNGAAWAVTQGYQQVYRVPGGIFAWKGRVTRSPPSRQETPRYNKARTCGFVVSGAAAQERASVTTRLSMRRALPRYAAIRITSCSLSSVAASRVAASTMSMASVRKPALSRRWLAWATREGR